MDTIPEEILRIIYRYVFSYSIKEMQDLFRIKSKIYECCNCGLKFLKKDNSNSYTSLCSHYCEREYYGFNRFE